MPRTIQAALSLLIFGSIALVSSFANAQAPAIDLALSQGGVLRGAIVSPNGAVVKKAMVKVTDDKGATVQVATDENGAFAVSGLQGGVYSIQTGSGVAVVRAWAPGLAPPKAVQQLLLIQSDDTVVRGQNGRHPWLNPRTVGTGLVVGGVVTGIVILATAS